MRNGKEEVEINGHDDMVFPNCFSNQKKPCGMRVVSNESLQLSRESRAFNIVFDLYKRAPDVVMVVLEGASANLPGATAGENMSALRACIQATTKLEVLAESSERPDRVDAHGLLVIHGTSECQFANDFQTCLITRGGMSKAMHHRDSTRVNVTLGVNSPQKTFDSFLKYAFPSSVDLLLLICWLCD